MAIRHLAAHEGETLTVLGEVTTLKLRDAAYTLVESAADPGHGLPPHTHADQDEAIYVVEGEYLLTSGEAREVLTPGSFAFVPRGTVHALTVHGTEPARSLIVFNPPGAMERFYDEVRTASESEGSVLDVLAIARRIGISLLTSPV